RSRNRGCEAWQRRRLEDRNELREVLADDVVDGRGERRLVVLPAHERGSVRLREEREPEADHEECNRDCSATWMPRERQGREPDRSRAAPPPAFEDREARGEDAGGDDRGNEGDQSGEDEQNGA